MVKCFQALCQGEFPAIGALFAVCGNATKFEFFMALKG